MTKEKITEGNILIARYMEADIKPYKIKNEHIAVHFTKGYPFEQMGKFLDTNVYICDSTLLSYHKDWNWIMEVLFKIIHSQSSDALFCGNNQVKNDTFCFMMLNDQINGISKDAPVGKEIEAVWQAVVEFIKNQPVSSEGHTAQ